MLLGTLALSACSPSIPQGAQWTDDPFRTDSTSSAQGSTASATKNRAATGNTDAIPRGSGTLRIAYAPGWRLPADYVSAFEAASGYTIEQSEYTPNASQNTDVIFGVDSKQAAALGTVIPVGNDPVCAWADRSWFSANSKPLPSSLKDLSSANFASLTAIPSQDSEAGAAFAAKAAPASESWEGIAVRGAKFAEERSLSEEGSALLFAENHERSAHAHTGSLPMEIAVPKAAACFESTPKMMSAFCEEFGVYSLCSMV